jgi:hypothetical protein
MATRKPQSEKSKAKRQRSWQKNQVAKELRIAEQRRREERNRELGSTGKQRANLARKQERLTQFKEVTNENDSA